MRLNRVQRSIVSGTFRHTRAALLLALLFAQGTSALEKGGAVPTLTPAPAGSHLRIRNLGDPVTLDWNRAHTSIERSIIDNLMEGLVRTDEKLSVVPSLAHRWVISPDGKTYTFFLRAGVQWSDGRLLSASDFVASWRRLLSAATASPYAYLLFDIVGAEDFHSGKKRNFEDVGIKALDPLTLEVRLRAPIAYWLWIPSFWSTFPIRQDRIDQHGTAWERPGNMLTLGPYTLASYDVGRELILRRNPKYWGKRGNVDQITLKILPDDHRALEEYNANGLDLVPRLSPATIEKLRQDPAMSGQVRTWPALRHVRLDFNTSRFPMSDPRVRRAIAQALDRSKLVARGLDPASTLVPPLVMGHSKNVGIQFDAAKAKEGLKAAGFGAAGAMQSLTLITASFDENRLIAEFIKAELKRNLGIEIVIKEYDPKQFYTFIRDIGDYALAIGTWGADFPDPDTFLSVFLSSSGNNKTQWKSPQYDHWVVESRSLADRSVREAVVHRAQKLLQEEAIATVPLYYSKNVCLVKPSVKGVGGHPIEPFVFNELSLDR